MSNDAVGWAAVGLLGTFVFGAVMGSRWTSEQWRYDLVHNPLKVQVILEAETLRAQAAELQANAKAIDK